MPPKSKVLKLEALALALEAQAFETWLDTYQEADRRRALLWLTSRLAERGLAPAPPEGIYDKPPAERLVYVEELLQAVKGRRMEGTEAIRELWPLYEQAQRVPELEQK